MIWQRYKIKLDFYTFWGSFYTLGIRELKSILQIRVCHKTMTHPLYYTIVFPLSLIRINVTRTLFLIQFIELVRASNLKDLII